MIRRLGIAVLGYLAYRWWQKRAGETAGSEVDTFAEAEARNARPARRKAGTRPG